VLGQALRERLTRTFACSPASTAVVETPRHDETGTKSPDNASLYEAEYGERETIIDLIPYMLETFIDSDRNFRQRNPHDDKSERFLKSSATVPTRATK
ncbi:DUF2274 domain-containing protein, partial [Nitratireductor sp. XY-223]|uniref:DUF2274 domain-containing protein n=1 Tax=Nitratireductor sp. XY-223 TaxID=2561926 RepID=UPI0010AA6CE9